MSSAKTLIAKLSTIATVTKRFSPFQLRILGLYAQFVRLAKHRPGLLDKVRHEFRAQSSLNPRTDSLLIDYKLRRARNQLDMLKANNVTSIKVVRLEE